MRACGENAICGNGIGGIALMLIVGLAAIGLLSLIKGKWR